MIFVKIFGISTNFIKNAEHKDFIHVLSNEIERKLASLDEMEGLPYDKTNIIQLIGLIEMNKIKFLNGDISGDRFYNDVDNALGLFEREHPGFDYLKDPALNVYFSVNS
jgi:hypothetical protein